MYALTVADLFTSIVKILPSIITVTRQPVDDVPSAKEHVILRVLLIL